MEAFLNLGVTLAFLVVGFLVGGLRERRHLVDLTVREEEFSDMIAVPLGSIGGSSEAQDAAMVQGCVVVSIDYFKRMVAGFIGIFGGRIDVYQRVVDRARREAMLRMLAEARGLGMDAVICVRVETSRLASARADGRGTSGIEILAFGTAIRLPSP